MSLGGRLQTLACGATLLASALAVSCAGPTTYESPAFRESARSIHVVGINTVENDYVQNDSVATWMRETLYSELKARESKYSVRLLDLYQPNWAEADALLNLWTGPIYPRGVVAAWDEATKGGSEHSKDRFEVGFELRDLNRQRLWGGSIVVRKEMFSREGLQRTVGAYVASKFPFSK